MELSDEELLRLIKRHGLAETAKRLHKRYSSVRTFAEENGVEVKRGRRKSVELDGRNKRIRAMRQRGDYLHTIGDAFSIGRERVRQILDETGGDPLHDND